LGSEESLGQTCDREMVVTRWGIGGRDGTPGALAAGVGDEVFTSYISYCS